MEEGAREAGKAPRGARQEREKTGQKPGTKLRRPRKTATGDRKRMRPTCCLPSARPGPCPADTSPPQLPSPSSTPPSPISASQPAAMGAGGGGERGDRDPVEGSRSESRPSPLASAWEALWAACGLAEETRTARGTGSKVQRRGMGGVGLSKKKVGPNQGQRAKRAKSDRTPPASQKKPGGIEAYLSRPAGRPTWKRSSVSLCEVTIRSSSSLPK